MRSMGKIGFGIGVCLLGLSLSGVNAQEGAAPAGQAAEQPAGQPATEETGAAEAAHEEAVEFTEAFLADPANIEGGKQIWQDQCRHCHGRSAYPGKAPKLKPKSYTPEFVFDRVTNGYRKMPAWKDVYTTDERMDIVAYVLSKKFAP